MALIFYLLMLIILQLRINCIDPHFNMFSLEIPSVLVFMPFNWINNRIDLVTCWTIKPKLCFMHSFRYICQVHFALKGIIMVEIIIFFLGFRTNTLSALLVRFLFSEFDQLFFIFSNLMVFFRI